MLQPRSLLISWKMVGLPMAPLPIIRPAAPVFPRHASADSADVTSPLAITGIFRALLTFAISFQLALPEKPCDLVLPCNVSS